MRPEIYFTHVDDIPGSKTPARCNRMTGEIIINRKKFKDIPPVNRLFILLHEYAHIELNSSNEFEVDKRAQELFVQMGYPLTESVKSLSRVLNPENKSHVARTRAMLNEAKKIDQLNNSTSMLSHTYQPNSAFYEDIFGLGKQAKAKKAAKIDKKQAKADAIRLKAQARLAKAEAKAAAQTTLAEQGIESKSPALGILGGVLGTATQIFGGDGGAIAGAITGNGSASNAPLMPAPMPVVNETTGIKKYMPWIIGGVVVLVAGVTIYFIKRKK